MSNDRHHDPRTFTKAETADFIQKIRQGMAATTDPLRGAIMNAICQSQDPRVTAIRRKCSFDQLRALVQVAAVAVEEQDKPSSVCTSLPAPPVGDGSAPRGTEHE